MSAIVLALIGLGACGEKPPSDAVLWDELGTTDLVKAERAIASLAANPERAIPFLQKRMRPVPIPDAHRLAGWLADLESDQYTTRQQASEELESLDDAVEPVLLAALKKRPPLESRRRIRWLLGRLRAERLSPPPERLRSMRAVEVLERIGTLEACRFLALLARGAPEAALTIEAKCALERLSRERITGHF